jgi:WD40 repeat protein
MSPDGTILAVATQARQNNRDQSADPVALWDVRGEPRPVGQLDGRPAATAFSADGRTLVTYTRDQTTWWNVADPADPRRLAQHAAHTDGAAGPVTFTPDGRLMVTTEDNGPGALWDTTNPAAPQLLSLGPVLGGGSPEAAVFHGSAFLVGTLGVVNIWDISEPRDPRRIAQFDSGGRGVLAGQLAVSPSGLLATVQLAEVPRGYHTGESIVRLWDLTPILNVLTDPVAVACQIGGGQMSPEMWRRYAPELSPQPICP